MILLELDTTGIYSIISIKRSNFILFIILVLKKTEEWYGQWEAAFYMDIGMEQWRRKGVGYLFHEGSLSNGLQSGPSPYPLHVRHSFKPPPCGLSSVWLQHHCLVWSIQVMFIITPTKLLYRGPHSVTLCMPSQHDTTLLIYHSPTPLQCSTQKQQNRDAQ